MTFLPLVNSYLHTAPRQRATYWLRCLYAAAALAVGVLEYLDHPTRPASRLASDLLRVLLMVSLVYCMAVGLVSTVDCVSREKREGTLGLLFLTDLKGWDIILGKLVAASLGGFYGLLATVPILALSLLFGGVSVGLVWQEVLLVLATFLFQVALGIFVSVLSRKQVQALVAAVAGLVFFNLVLPVIGGVLLYVAPSHRSLLGACLLLPSPVLTLIISLAPVPVRILPPHYFWWSLATLQGLTWLMLVVASLILPHCWQDRPAEGWKARWQRFRQRWSFGRPERRRGLRACLLELNPCCWLAGRFCSKPACVWTFLALLGGLWVWGGWYYGADWYQEGTYFSTAFLINSVLKLWVALEAGRQLFEDRQTGALEMLLTSPVSVKEMVRGQLLALQRQFLGPFVVATGVQLIFLAAALQRESFGANPLTPTLWVVAIVMLVADSVAACWVGMWAALTVKRPNSPPAATALRLFIAPWLLYYVMMVAIDASFDLHASHLTWRFYVGWWMVVGLLFDLAYGVSAWRQLRNHFRRLAVERPVSFGEQLRGWFGRKVDGPAGRESARCGPCKEIQR